MEENRKTKTITGIVYSSKKDDNGNVISVLIDSLDEDQEVYRVSQDKKGDMLLELVNKTVEVTGSVTEDAKGYLFINVIDFILPEET